MYGDESYASLRYSPELADSLSGHIPMLLRFTPLIFVLTAELVKSTLRSMSRLHAFNLFEIVHFHFQTAFPSSH